MGGKDARAAAEGIPGSPADTGGFISGLGSGLTSAIISGLSPLSDLISCFGSIFPNSNFGPLGIADKGGGSYFGFSGLGTCSGSRFMCSDFMTGPGGYCGIPGPDGMGDLVCTGGILVGGVPDTPTEYIAGAGLTLATGVVVLGPWLNGRLAGPG